MMFLVFTCNDDLVSARGDTAVLLLVDELENLESQTHNFVVAGITMEFVSTTDVVRCFLVALAYSGFCILLSSHSSATAPTSIYGDGDAILFSVVVLWWSASNSIGYLLLCILGDVAHLLLCILGDVAHHISSDYAPGCVFRILVCYLFWNLSLLLQSVCHRVFYFCSYGDPTTNAYLHARCAIVF